MVKQIVNLTKEGKADLEKELEGLVARRPAIAERLQTARAFGDLSENQEYTDARSEQKTVETRIQEIEEILKNAKVIRSGTKTKVAIGATVKLKLAGKTQTYSIVGPVEADPLNGKISNESPIGQAILGLKVGESFTLPNGNSGKILELL